jgi:hypothetical protein
MCNTSVYKKESYRKRRNAFTPRGAPLYKVFTDGEDRTILLKRILGKWDVSMGAARELDRVVVGFEITALNLRVQLPYTHTYYIYNGLNNSTEQSDS